MNLIKKITRRFRPERVDPAKAFSERLKKSRMSEQILQSETSGFSDPRPQSFYGFEKGKWQKSNGDELPSCARLPTIKLISWNIDFQAAASRARMKGALSYLHELLSSLPPDMPSVILLQEMLSTDLDIIQSTKWIQEKFHITDISPKDWESLYGTTTLVDRRLRLASVFRVRYASNMERDALFLDIEDMTATTLRFCNTHLESLVAQPPLRPAQLKLAARYLKDPIVDGGVIAGDFNAIQDFDKTLHTENELKDAYLETGKEDEHEDGWTWGMQSGPEMRRKYGCSRLDKIMYCGRAKVQNLQRIGAEVKTECPGEGQYVTDHLGLMGDISIEKN